MRFTTLALLSFSTSLLSGNAWAQAPAPAGQATLAQCVQVIKGDSAVLYYNASYSLTPTACATIRRNTRIAATGDFKGETRDYSMATNKLLYVLHYQDGKRHGRYESYFPNGQRAVQGFFTQGVPTGTWEFWYANGQHRQTLEWTGQAMPRLRIIAYWDSTGQQGVAEGNGRWFDVMRTLGRRYGGPVVGGYAHGTWESRLMADNRLVTKEEYEKGRFKEGTALDYKAARYKDRPLLEPQLEEPTGLAEMFRLGSTCEALQAARQLAELQRNARTVAPKPAGDPTAFLQSVIQGLSDSNDNNQWEIIPDGREFVVEATTDELGNLKLVSGQGGGGIITALSQTISSMRAWMPATVNEKPVAGVVQFTITKRGPSWHMSYRARARMEDVSRVLAAPTN